MINSTIAKRYAASLVQLSDEAGQIENVRNELAEIDSFFTANPEILSVFANPALSLEQKKNIMQELVKLFSCSELVGNFLLLLVDKSRVEFFGDIVQAYETKADEHTGVLRPIITTAFELDPGQLASIQGALEKKSAKKIIPRVTVDNTLLGGIVVQIGDTVYDSSVKTQLNRIQDLLQKG